MKKQLIYIMLFPLLLNSCINMNNPKDQAEYISCYNSFDKGLVEHIPNKLPNNHIGYGLAPLNTDMEYYNPGIHIKTKISINKKYLEIKQQYMKKAKYKRSSADLCFAIVKDFENTLKTKFDSINCKEFLPIPQYAIYEWDNYNSTYKNINISDIVILDCKPSVCLKREKLKYNKNMPIGWENGYSKGLTFNDKEQTIIYWLIIW